jgi:hypothetical protein
MPAKQNSYSVSSVDDQWMRDNNVSATKIVQRVVQDLREGNLAIIHKRDVTRKSRAKEQDLIGNGK